METLIFLSDSDARHVRLGGMAHKSPGLVWDLNPGPLAPKARIIPLDQRAAGARVWLSPPPDLPDVLPVSLEAGGGGHSAPLLEIQIRF